MIIQLIRSLNSVHGGFISCKDIQCNKNSFVCCPKLLANAHLQSFDVLWFADRVDRQQNNLQQWQRLICITFFQMSQYYYYSFPIIESIPKAHILLSLLYHNRDHNLSSSWHNVSHEKNKAMYTELNKNTYILLTSTCVSFYMRFCIIMLWYCIMSLYWQIQTERKQKFIKGISYEVM